MLIYCLQRITSFARIFNRYEGQRDMLFNQTYNLDQVSFAAEGIKDAQQTVCSMEFMLFSDT